MALDTHVRTSPLRLPLVACADDLPLYGMLGKKNPKDPLDRVQPVHGLEKEGIYTNEVWLENHRMTPMDLYTHQQYEFEYNGNHIVGVKVNMLEPVKITKGDMDNIGTFNMYYSVKWVENKNYTFHNRFERYLDKQFFEHKIHWFAIFNSFMMVIFLVGLVSLILMRTLRRDFQRYNADEEALELMEHDVNDETGWKLVHGDVFRPVENLMELTVLIGTGIQLTVLALLIIVFALFGELWVSRSAMISCTIFSWAFTSFVGGYVSGGMYARNDGDDWIKAFVVYATSFPSFCFVLGFFVNLVSIYWGALAQVSIFTIFILLLVWLLISFPLSLAGTVIGRNWAGSADLPCRVKRIPSPIPIVPIYLHPVVIAIFSGVLPFGSIFIELYFVMTSFWSYKIYYVYEFMLLSFIILIIVTACVSIVATYFLLNSENYHWQWTSYASGASISIYIYLYCIYYFMYKSHMDGWFQFIYFFGYSLMFAVGIGIMCGAIGFLASSVFVRRIYRNVKCD